jgi:hypothetical protein
VTGCCEHGNELSVSIKAGNFLTSCVTVSFWSKDSAPCSYIVDQFSYGIVNLFLCNCPCSGTIIHWHVHAFLIKCKLLMKSTCLLNFTQNIWKLKVTPVYSIEVSVTLHHFRKYDATGVGPDRPFLFDVIWTCETDITSASEIKITSDC